jgi:hypothetical protein
MDELSGRTSDGAEAPRQGVLIRAENGDVIGFDETGLVLRLSDRVVDELRGRLGLDGADPALLGDIEAWDLRRDGDWLRFTARLEEGGPRGYRRRVAGGDIIADAPGPLLAILSLGGARRAGFNPGPVRFPYHVAAPGDHVHSVGLEGTESAALTDALQRLPHASRDALIGDALVAMRAAGRRALPLYFVRAETDGSARVGDLGQGVAYRNFLTALDNLVSAAASLGRRAQVLAVSLDYGPEDGGTPADEMAQGLRRLMAQIEADMAARGLCRPVFLMTAEAGTRRLAAHPSLQAHAELSWLPGPHRLMIPAPGYMFAQTEFGRPTEDARLRMAEMDAYALRAAEARRPWFCPTFLLAEHQGTALRVTARAMGPLVLDDALGAGAAAGFSVVARRKVRVMSVSVAKDDPQALILRLSQKIDGPARLLYAMGGEGVSPDALPVNRGGVRDEWQAVPPGGGAMLHRWALPCDLQIQPGGL